MSEKTALTPEERIKAAYLHIVRGVSQQDIAVAFEVNSGRVAEAIMAQRMAAEDPLGTRRAVEDEA